MNHSIQIINRNHEKLKQRITGDLDKQDLTGDKALFEPIQ